MKKRFLLFAIAVVFTVLLCYGNVASAETESDYRQSKAYNLVKDICETFPDRRAGVKYKEPQESGLQEYLKSKINEYSSNTAEVNYLPFTYDNLSYYFNIEAVLNKDGGEKQIIFGAHYDSEGEGANDNASGVAAMLLILENLSRNADKLPCSVKFVFFDGEEYGLLGSQTYVAEMSQTDKENTLVMFNIDSIANGDESYLWCENKRTDLADLILSNADAIKEKPYAKGTFNLNDNYGYGYYETPQNSDHTPFRLSGIPTALFFSGTYSASAWGYEESVNPNKQVMNTSLDTFENLEKNNGGAFVDRINAVVNAATQTVLSGEFYSVAENARNQLLNLKLWYSTLWPFLIVVVLVIALIVVIILQNRKLQKKAILGTAEVKTSKVFTTPDAEDIFKFKD